MTDEILAYLLDKKEKVSSVELAETFLKFKNPGEKLAHTAISAILKNDARFIADDHGRWGIDPGRLKLSGPDLRRLPWITVNLYYHETVILHISVWRVFPVAQSLFSCWFKDPDTLPYDEQQVLVSPQDEPFSAEERTGRILELLTLLQKNMPVFLNFSEMMLVAQLGTEAGEPFDDAGAYFFSTLAAAADVKLPRPLTLDALKATLLSSSGESGYAYRSGGVAAECCDELFTRLAARGITTLQALEQEQNKSVDRSYFIGKQFSYEEICALPMSFGVYGFKNKDGSFIYIGKSQNLRRRLQSYFTDSEELTPKIKHIQDEAHALVTYACGSGLECLLYEYRLIQKHKPCLNTQVRLHERKGEFAPLEDCLVLLRHADADKGMSFWFRANQKIILKPFQTSFCGEPGLVGELDEFFFSKKLAAHTTDFAEYEIAFRWIKSNYDTLVMVEVGRYASAQEVYNALKGYWKEVH
jgi:hypothetical protein